ncbi:conserved hypothetical protein [Candidatus Desulfarcum epimagneticum]|uniref:FAD/NAD(P)-binding domain-containing protein n=1 Tax=uncultured Desulfobacteraceae bacterium TaxID=218296 RepID=A0A484HH64_9BACT|nr:conserved hypothetical protein [uncultured Desulfobacteraceae bacterium]
MRHVIIGNGIAGISAAETIRENRPDDEIIVISDENAPPYLRANLSRYVIGDLPLENMRMKPPGWFETHSIRRVHGKVSAILPDEKKVVCLKEDGEDSLDFDRLCVAVGASPNMPPIPGRDLSGIHVYRSMKDAGRVKAAIPGCEKIAVVGGGLLGLEVVEIALRNEKPCALLQRGHIGKPLLDKDESADILLPRVSGEDGVHNPGARVILGRTPEAFIGENGRLKGVRLSDGMEVSCDMAVMCVGISTDPALFENSGLEFDRCLVVDERQRTSAPDIYGAGDCVAYPDKNGRLAPTRTWALSRVQGKTAGLNMSGVPRKMWDEGPLYNASHLFDMTYVIIGDHGASGEGFSRFASRPDASSYRKLVFRGDVMAGALLIGDRGGSRGLRRLIAEEIPVPSDEDKKRLLDSAFDPDALYRELT